MQINSLFVPILNKIDFIKRYKDLSIQFNYELKESFEDYSRESALEIIKEFGYTVSYNKKENFYKIIERVENYKFQFNIVLKYGIVELIWTVWEDNELLQIGGPWGMIKYLLDFNEEDKVKLPVFRNYEDLKEILMQAFSIYEDFKKEVLKSFNKGNKNII
ncbi:DUF2513 domain-containing protein [Candidatus Ornithobacterium hominis]|uniref:hypothetical protein n=1 Tax=Candidatus Ornithobacterium hominis TaxID=2497989 RepID=UPI0024BCDDFE|nr:hypothetical protein [Candidatus Ornithobacterium hominis]CAI9429304.1 DUF2513 domain-containing protein [Candidatus Ornithobacterium hominis]